MQNDIAQLIQEQVIEAHRSQNPVEIISNGSKHFYGNSIQATPLIVSQHQGVINYEPTELVITARAGTPLDEIEKVLSDNGQQLAFEPPHFRVFDTTRNRSATLGGTIACGFSGPARANAGSVRDFLLGCEIINGLGEQLKFGGQVMKNVAGYDVSRLMSGSMGTLGIILNASLKTLPKHEHEISLSFSLSRDQAFEKLTQWNLKPYQLTASTYHNGTLTVRLSGNAEAVNVTHKLLGGERLENSPEYWQYVKEQLHPFFKTDKPLWRISSKPQLDIPLTGFDEKIDMGTDSLSEWHGTLHWIKTTAAADKIRKVAEKLGGHATLYRQGVSKQNTSIFHPLTTPLFTIHKNLKMAFDPKDILNRNKMYAFNLHNKG